MRDRAQRPSMLGRRIARFCNRGLGRYKTPRVIRFVDDLPRGPSGKVQRLQLAALRLMLPACRRDAAQPSWSLARSRFGSPESREPGAVARPSALAGLTGAIVDSTARAWHSPRLPGMPPYSPYSGGIPANCGKRHLRDRYDDDWRPGRSRAMTRLQPFRYTRRDIGKRPRMADRIRRRRKHQAQVGKLQTLHLARRSARQIVDKANHRGVLYRPTRGCKNPEVLFGARWPLRTTTHAMIPPVVAIGNPTARRRDRRMPQHASSISRGAMFSPPLMISSLMRPVMK